MKSISVPFRFTGGRVAATRDYSSIVRQKIIDVLTTSPAQRMGFPNYGANAYSLLFESVDELVASDFITDATIELQNRVSGIRIHDMRIQQSAENETTAEIMVKYSLPLSPTQTLTFNITSLLDEESPL